MTRYERGFLTKCAEYGLDANASMRLMKEAMKIPGAPRAKKALLRLKQRFTGELAKKIEHLDAHVADKFDARTRTFWDMVSDKRKTEEAIRDLAMRRWDTRTNLNMARAGLENVDNEIDYALARLGGDPTVMEIIKSIPKSEGRFEAIKKALVKARKQQIEAAKSRLAGIDREAAQSMSEGLPRYERLVRDIERRNSEELAKFGPRVLGDADRLERILKKTDRWLFRRPGPATRVERVFGKSERPTGTRIRRILSGTWDARPPSFGRVPDNMETYTKLLSDSAEPHIINWRSPFDR